MKRRQSRWAMALWIVAGLLLFVVGFQVNSWRLTGLGALVLAGCALVWFWHGTSGPTARRWQRRSTRHEGLASWPQTLRATSPVAYRRQVQTLAPHTQQLKTWQRHNPRTVPINALSRPVGYIGWGPAKIRVRGSVEDGYLFVGGPRRGKSGSIATLIASAHGPVLVTSTRQDLYRVTAPLRAKKGPVWVFNPSAATHTLDGEPPPLPTTVTFNPLTGCADPGRALDRASDLINGTDLPGEHATGDHKVWTELGTLALASLLHAAALRPGYTMRDVSRWVAQPDDSKDEIMQLLQASPEPNARVAASQFLDTNPRTRDGITTSIRPALTWLTHPPAATAAGLGPAGTFVVDDDGMAIAAPTLPELDVDEFLASNGTLYLLGAYDVKTAPLVAAFAAEFARQARRIAGTLADERLDPPLLLALDEAALICPIPLHRWTADMGGRNITIAIAVQSRAQLRERYGDEGAATIISNVGTIILYGGIKDTEDGDYWSKLIGTHTVMEPHYDQHGRYQGERPVTQPILTPAGLAQLPERRIVVIPRNGRPMICRAEMGWRRWDVKRAKRRNRPVTPPPPNRTAAQNTADSTRPDWSAANNAAGSLNGRAGSSSPVPPRQGDQDRSKQPQSAGPEPS